MLKYRNPFIQAYRKKQSDACTLIQRYCKGYLTFKVWKDAVHGRIIKGLVAHYREQQRQIYERVQPVIRYHWLKKVARIVAKREKAAKKKAEEEAKKKKAKGRLYGSK